MAGGNNNIVVRLLFNSDDFAAKLGMSKKELESFGNKVTSSVGGALKGIAGAAGLAFGAMETFDRIIKANEANNDRWENVMRTMNNTVNEFFSAITSGDFSLFSEGLDDIKRKAEEAAEALRHMDDVQLGYNYFTAKNNTAFTEQLNVLRDKTSTEDQKATAKSNIQGIIDDQKGLAESYHNSAIEAVLSVLTERSALKPYMTDTSMIEKAMYAETNKTKDVDKWLAELNQYRAELVNLRDEYTDVYESLEGGTVTITDFDNPEYKAKAESLAVKYAQALVYDALYNKLNGEINAQIIGWMQSAESALRSSTQMEGRLLRYNTGEESGQTSGTKGRLPETEAAEGSIDWYEAEIAKLNKTISSTTDKSVQIQAQKTIDEYKKQIASIQTSVSAAITREEFVPLEKLDAITPESKAEIEESPGLADAPDMSNKISEMDGYGESVEGVTSSLNALSGVMGSLTGMVDEQTASWMSYGMGILQAVAQAVPAITSLTGAKNAEANANTAALASGAGSAVASIPYVGPIMAVAAIASVVAALASIPKFADGGIVGGSSYYGDRLLARVNSGEMVLNTRQQQRLLSQMDRPAQDVHVSGDFKIAGRDLRLVLDRYDTYRRQ